ncbi:MAG: phosphatidylglycerophosphatase A [Proteobacteria bacterium]|nr:phosphatidylglycerophosphatase A [Pseudomonadota bacterium]
MSASQKNNIANKINTFLATGFYSGLSPIMPGTCGTATITAIYILGFYFYPSILSPLSTAVIAVGISLSAVAVSNNHLTLHVKEQKDPQEIVIDEFAGFATTIAFHQIANLNILLLGFLFFRIFDMTKPLLIRKAENLPKGLGIVADDVVAGVCASICLLIVEKYL